jgi:WD40 repeat protein/class 3 adenylate cyclase
MADSSSIRQFPERRLAAILAADIAGYSRLMGRDEVATVRDLKAHQSIVLPMIAQFGGKIVDKAGDGVLAQFPSAVRAVECAIAIQQTMGERNQGVPEDRKMQFRVGVNLGDIIGDARRVYGDGVNVAARLEVLSPPGGICISEAVHTQVRDRVSVDFLDLGEHKVKNIARPVRVYGVPIPSENRAISPFRGLDSFDFDHADLFFGRTHAIASCVERLEQLAASGKSFLLIYGMSGSGKSSLLRAGLLPRITKPGGVAGIVLWRRCLIRPSESPDAVASLAAGLLNDAALPELAENKTSAELTNLFQCAPDRGLALIRAALSRAASAAGFSPAQARLLIAVDQMEELFTTITDPASRESLVRLLSTLSSSGLVWVICAIRADFFHRCSEIPGFSKLKDGLGNYELLAPTGAEIAQMIREPARAAGLRFEEDPDAGRLDDLLQRGAVADPGSLPLLEFMLDALYQAGCARGLLTFADYRALGGLEGAIARRADEVFEALPLTVQEALPAVLRALITVRDEAVGVRPALAADVANTQAKATLVDALIAARLLVTDENVEGHAVIRLAHEALLSRWPRARDIAAANRSFLETRARLQADARRWLSGEGSPDLLLPPGVRLAEGEELLRSRREEVDDQIINYVNASAAAQREREESDRQAERRLIEAAEAAKRERLERQAERLAGEAERRSLAAAAATHLARRTRYAALIALVLAVIAGAGAIVGLRGEREAERQALLAESNANQAKGAEAKAFQARDEALRSQSLSLSSLSQQTTANGDTEAAILLALEALPEGPSISERPYLFEAEAALYRALFAHRAIKTLRHDAGVTYAAFDANGARIVTSSSDRTARIWKVGDGAQIALLKGHEDVVETATFSPDGKRVLTGARDGTARLWNARSGEQILVLDQPGAVHTAQFSPDGTRILTASDRDLRIWDAQTGKQIMTVPDLQPMWASFSPDGRSFAAGQYAPKQFAFWSTEDGQQIRHLDALYWYRGAAIRPDGTRLLVTGWHDSPSLIWDVSTGVATTVLKDHRTDNVCGTFDHDGRLAVTASFDGTARLWNGVTGELFRALGEEYGGLLDTDLDREREWNCEFSPDDRFLATASLDGVIRVWNVETGSQFVSFKASGELIRRLAFSPVGNQLLTASNDGTARLWDVNGVLTTALIHKYPPTFAVFSPDNLYLVTGGGDSVAHLWEVASGREIAQLDTKQMVQSAAFSPDGARVATGSLEGRIRIWDVATKRQLAELEAHSGLQELQFSPDGDLLLSVSIGTAQLWDTKTGIELAVLKTSGGFPHAVFSPDGHLVLTVTDDNTGRLSKLTGSEAEVLSGLLDRITAVGFSPDGQSIVMGSRNGAARIWSVKNGNSIATLKGHSKALTNVEFSPDGLSLVTASRDGTARIWSASDGTQKVVLRGHRGVVDSARFSPNGAYILTMSSQDGTVRLWATQSGRELAVLANPDEKTKGPTLRRAAFNSDGTRIAIVSGKESVQIVRAFPTSRDLIAYAKSIVQRKLTPCERRRFFLPVEGVVADCPP